MFKVDDAFKAEEKKVNYDGITDTRDWDSLTSMSEKRLSAERAVKLFLWRKKDTSLIKKLWQVDLLPAKQVVRRRDSAEHWLIQSHSFSLAAWAYPVDPDPDRPDYFIPSKTRSGTSRTATSPRPAREARCGCSAFQVVRRPRRSPTPKARASTGSAGGPWIC
jgi:hypothetical protein